MHTSKAFICRLVSRSPFCAVCCSCTQTKPSAMHASRGGGDPGRGGEVETEGDLEEARQGRGCGFRGKAHAEALIVLACVNANETHRHGVQQSATNTAGSHNRPR